jgi:glycolate oxidase FAD binding subunit
VLTVRCGTRLNDIESLLASQGQRLAFDPPRHGPSATIGGAVATGLAGPSRQRSGALRDHVLGVRLLAGDGRRLRFGGEVIKNVAGYDVSRLMAGSLGILAVLLEVSLKVLPQPRGELTLCFERGHSDALDDLARWSGSGLPISAGAWVEQSLHARFEGTTATLASVRRALGGTPVDHAAAFWASLRDQSHAFFAGQGRLWRLHLPPGAGQVGDATTMLVEWQGGQRWCRARDEEEYFSVAAAAGGSATLYRGAREGEEVFAPLAPAVQALHHALKQVFDPAGILNPGRMYARL